MDISETLIVVKGGGDLAGGVIRRLKRAGFPLIVTELAAPLFVRRTVSFGESVYAGRVEIEGIAAQHAATPEEAQKLATTAVVPVLVDPRAAVVDALRPAVVVDAVMAKRNTGTHMNDAPLVIALGPGFTAGEDCHAVVETMRGHNLGRLIYAGSAQPNTGTPGIVGGHGAERVLRAPAAGHVEAYVAISERVRQDQRIAAVAGKEVRAPFDGVLRGIIHPSVMVTPGMKIGDVDPRDSVDHCFTISDKALAIGGAVLEAVLAWKNVTWKRISEAG
ncbi:MAG: EF2563 family selenium-dependent molybdenum hydroxylase system protein [Caldilineaceae bacterium]|nr:EF2563 family selenium-dependent molybdenum hydroxylase system protein [Caldilineaceae bacterium]